MKKLFVIVTLTLLLTIPIATATTTQIKSINATTQNTTSRDFTHDVIAEYVTTTTCPYCPTASNQLYSIYQSNDYPFHYVTMVADANTKIYARIQELGVSGVPVVFFD